MKERFSAHRFWHIPLLVAVAVSFATEANAAKGGNGGGKNKPGESEPGQIISVQLFLDEFHSSDGVTPNGLISDYLRNNPDNPEDNASYVHGEDGADIVVGENFNIGLDPSASGSANPVRSYAFPFGITVDVGCSDLDPLCVPDLGTTKVKGQVVPVLVCGDTSGPLLPLDGRAPDAYLDFLGSNHDDSPVGCVRHVNARLRVTDDNGEDWRVFFGGYRNGGGKLQSPCGSCIAVERVMNIDGYAIWTFRTEAPHIGYLYRVNPSPHSSLELQGTVTLPFSGVLVSMNPEPEPEALNCEDFPDSGPCPQPPN